VRTCDLTDQVPVDVQVDEVAHIQQVLKTLAFNLMYIAVALAVMLHSNAAKG
jgi:Flp pilus assembly secretin CpaC